MSPYRIGVVGSGPTAIYLLKHLISVRRPLEITIFEAKAEAGYGMPYDPEVNAECMLCNAFSREIPELTQTLFGWLKQQPDRELSEWEVSHHDVSPRAFYPRVLLGEFFRDELDALIRRAESSGHRVEVGTSTAIRDMLPVSGTVLLKTATGETEVDCAVITTGHSWPADPTIDGVDLISPWPSERLEALPAGRIATLGSSLSAIDVAVALAYRWGRFDEDGNRIVWTPNDDAEEFHLTMISRRGIMPEGDFYYPFPYEPLAHITEDAVAAEIDEGPDGLLERVFVLLLRELRETDPEWLDSLGPEAAGIPGFADGYFRHRERIGGLEAVRDTFADARTSMREQRTIPWRYTMLRAHGAFDPVVRSLGPAERETFDTHLMPVFADCYAAVPHLSIARLLALDDAGRLSLIASGEDAAFAAAPGGGVEVRINGSRHRFSAMIDARGQSPGAPSTLPFPTLAEALADGAEPVRAPFRLSFKTGGAAAVYCLAMPQLLEDHPFSQGLMECARFAHAVAEDIAESIGTEQRDRA